MLWVKKQTNGGHYYTQKGSTQVGSRSPPVLNNARTAYQTKTKRQKRQASWKQTRQCWDTPRLAPHERAFYIQRINETKSEARVRKTLCGVNSPRLAKGCLPNPNKSAHGGLKRKKRKRRDYSQQCRTLTVIRCKTACLNFYVVLCLVWWL